MFTTTTARALRSLFGTGLISLALGGCALSLTGCGSIAAKKKVTFDGRTASLEETRHFWDDNKTQTEATLASTETAPDGTTRTLNFELKTTRAASPTGFLAFVDFLKAVGAGAVQYLLLTGGKP